ncbi:MAG TPA: YggS family pyridoxal phosphate-dependent enzyme [Solirubrobacteraceae bacterium]|nr:YggS family pyridoxal phosphate-dependent enzyme [Solirubrobacteraceae bacterium]
MVELRPHLDADRVRANLARITEHVEEARARSLHGASSPVEILAAAKYVPSDALPVLAEAGVTLLGENRAQDLQEKVAAHGNLFRWDFIGQLQSRRVRAIVPHVRMVHSLGSESARSELERHRAIWQPGLRVLVQVNVAGEDAKAGVAPRDLAAFIDAADLPIAGLMTMPPLAGEPEQSRSWFAALRELAAEHGLQELSMGTSQDHVVAVEEGATIVRIGTSLYD